MPKIQIPEGLKGKELHKFLVQHKGALIAQKKSIPKRGDNVSADTSLYVVTKEGAINKADTASKEFQDADTVHVGVVANTAWWLDRHKDVTIDDCWKKSVKESLSRMKHCKDHNYCMDSELGDVTAAYGKDISLRELGIEKDGKTQCLIVESDIYRWYDEKTFLKYKKGKVKQHSIGLWIVKIELAINAPEYKEEFATWNKYIDKIINKDFAEEDGYFWVLQEIKVIEVSAVLFGANEITPTYFAETGDDEGTEEEPPKGTKKQPPATAKKVKFGALITT